MFYWFFSNYDKICPVLVFVLNFLSSVGYMIKGDFGKTIFFLGGSLVTGAAAFLLK